MRPIYYILISWFFSPPRPNLKPLGSFYLKTSIPLSLISLFHYKSTQLQYLNFVNNTDKTLISVSTNLFLLKFSTYNFD